MALFNCLTEKMVISLVYGGLCWFQPACIAMKAEGIASTSRVEVVAPVIPEDRYRRDTRECSQRSMTSIVPVSPEGRYECDSPVCFIMPVMLSNFFLKLNCWCI